MYNRRFNAMGQVKPIELGHRTFPTKTAAIEYFRSLLAHHAVGDVLCEGSPDFGDVRALLERHPERDQKVGCGIESFIIRLDNNKHKMFWLRRSDGTETDFSFYSCVKGHGPSLRQEFAEAARFSIHREIRAHKERYFSENSDAAGLAPCQETGQPMVFADAQVDHHPITFDYIIDRFLETLGVSPSREILSAPTDRQQTTTFVCADTERHFVQFHRDHATLLVVHKSVNLGRDRVS
jgi:hypothetical protein